MYNPPVLGDVNGLLGAINMGNAVGGTNWPGVRLRSGTAHGFRARQQRRHHRGVARRAAGRVSRISATCRVSPAVRSRKCSGPGDCCAADSPRAQPKRVRSSPDRRGPRPRPRRAPAPAAAANARRTDHRWPLDPEAAVRHDLGRQSRSRRDRLAGAARRYAGQRAQPPGAARA